MKAKFFKTIVKTHGRASLLGRGLSVLRSPFAVLLIALAMAVGCDKEEKDATVAVTGVTVSPTTKTLDVGGTFTFTVAVTPDDASDKSVTWTSSSTVTATVSNTGLVTAAGTGTAVITATANDGSGKKGAATVTVTADEPEPPASVPVTGVTISPSEEQNLVVGGTFTASATVTPSDASNKDVTWSSSDEAVATVDQTGLVTAEGEGGATITVTSDADNSKTASVAVTVTATSSPLAIDKTAIAPPFAGGTYEVAVTTELAWRATVNSEATSWVTLTDAGATGNGTVTVAVMANLTTTAPAPATVTFTAGDVTKTVTVTQAAAPALLTFCEKCGWNGSAWVDAYVTTYYYPFDGNTTTKLHLFSAETVPEVTGATSDKDGRANTAAIAAVAADGDPVKRCTALGSGWYLPAYEEVINISGGTTNAPLNGLSGLSLLNKTASDFVHTSTIGASKPDGRVDMGWNTAPWLAQDQIKVFAEDGKLWHAADNSWDNGFHCYWRPE